MEKHCSKDRVAFQAIEIEDEQEDAGDRHRRLDETLTTKRNLQRTGSAGVNSTTVQLHEDQQASILSVCR